MNADRRLERSAPSARNWLRRWRFSADIRKSCIVGADYEDRVFLMFRDSQPDSDLQANLSSLMRRPLDAKKSNVIVMTGASAILSSGLIFKWSYLQVG